MAKILSVDDHGVIAAGIDKFAQQITPGSSVVNARDALQAVKMLQSQSWDLIVLDITLGGRSGLDLLKDIKHLYPNLPVLMLSLHTGVEFARRALKSGASGYVSKDCPEEELFSAIKTVLSGGKYVSSRLRDELLFNAELGGHQSLSEREFEVLVGIGLGKTVREMADDLNISESTVETYRARIKQKMGLSRDADLIRYCVAAGLVQIAPFSGEAS